MVTIVEPQQQKVLDNDNNGLLLAGASVEDRLRAAVKYKNIRIREFFRDFDPLRKGVITVNQFQRCLTHYFNISLTETELLHLATKYGSNDNIDYHLFSETIDRSFDPDQLDGRPEAQVITVDDKGTSVTLSSDELLITQQLISKCYSYCRYRGIVVKDCYADFDRHHIGLVTKSQFHRSFPGPPEISEEDVTLLAKRYLEPDGLCNYLHFHYDVCQVGRVTMAGSNNTANSLTSNVCDDGQSSLQQILSKIGNVVFKNGIRTTEFFKDHDKLNSGVITQNQFLCGLSLCCGHLARLSRSDMQLVAEHYCTSDGRVNYRKFCDLMEHVHNVPQLEKKPTELVQRPPRGHLLQQMNVLESEEMEEQVSSVLQRLRNEVGRRQLLVYPYLQDFDRSCSQTGGVTQSQFERMINFLSLPVTVPEMELIVQKFRKPTGGDINYVAFAQAIDDQFTGHALQSPSAQKTPEKNIASQPTMYHTGHCDVDGLLTRLQEHVLINRIRITELFKDSDPLRSGVITCGRFRQGLATLTDKMTDEQFTELCQRYAHPTMKDHVKWKIFVEEIDQVFTDVNLERAPTKRLTSLAPLPREGATVWYDTATDEQKILLQQATNKLSAQLGQRRLLARPYFQDFDRHKHGYVTRTQFQQCLSQLGVSLTTDEMEALIGHFSDKEGVNYIAVLQCVDPSVPEQNKYQLRLAMLTQPNKTTMSHDIPSGDEVLIKIKIKVSRQPVRVVEFFKDYDKMRTGRVSVTAFRRGIDLCQWGLSDDEVIGLVNKYLTVNNMVDYQLFAEHVESVFTTQELEKTPLKPVTQFLAPPDVEMKQLTGEQDQLLGGVLLRMADKVRERRIQLLPLFEDYDPVHSGCVSHSQFHRVLDELQLYNMLSAQEMDVLAARFGVQKGGRHDMNYIHFCAHVDSIAVSAHEQLVTQ